jgi:hypothetical protein
MKDCDRFSKCFWIAVALWVLLAIVVIGYVATHPGHRSVTQSYWDASRNWLDGKDLYEGTGFYYLPQSAVLQIPFTVLPLMGAEISWRILNLVLFASSCFVLSQSVRAESKSFSFLVVTLFAIPISFSSARNGQVNLTIAALFNLLFYFWSLRRYALAVCICLVGIALKQYFIVPFLLFNAMELKRCFRYSAVGLVVLLAFPFLFGRSEYVLGQYASCLQSMGEASAEGRDAHYAYFFGMLKVCGLDVSTGLQNLAALVAAVGVLAYCVKCLSGLDLRCRALLVVFLSVAFVLLFSPRTENNTYCLAGGLSGVFFMLALREGRGRALLLGCLLCAYVFMFGSYEIGKLFTPGRAIWLAPLGMCLFVAYVLVKFVPGEVRASKVA